MTKLSSVAEIRAGRLPRLLRALAGDCESTDGWEDAAATCRESADDIERKTLAIQMAMRHLGDDDQTMVILSAALIDKGE